ncbi:GTP 3',8-cyclase MoaA [Desulfovibrio sp. OttesenSCG-928-G15]|nr:GTP 3',8-cyclase MoaA [Desulfovibrio sp. OttesenSCG-928-G15]
MCGRSERRAGRLPGSGPELPPEPRLVDSHGRVIDYARLSLTDRCNFRCVYCMPEHGRESLPHKDILSYEELLGFCRVSASLGISRFKITGGEPFCRKGVESFIQRLNNVPGVRQITVTTNGMLLEKHLPLLCEVGVSGINVSLDTLNPDRFAALSRSAEPLQRVLSALDAAKQLGLAVKINTVPLKGRNEEDLPELVAFALERGFFLRFIELMPVGEGCEYEPVSQESIRDMVEKRFGTLQPLQKRIGNGPAEHFTVAGHAGGVGFISALSKKFCHACNRLRLTSQGYLKTCLHHNKGIDLMPLLRGDASDAELALAIRGAVKEKPLSHEFDPKAGLGGRGRFNMNSVGG